MPTAFAAAVTPYNNPSAPGEVRTLNVNIKRSDRRFFNTDMQRLVGPGSFTIHAGPNSVDLTSVKLMVS